MADPSFTRLDIYRDSPSEIVVKLSNWGGPVERKFGLAASRVNGRLELQVVELSLDEAQQEKGC